MEKEFNREKVNKRIEQLEKTIKMMEEIEKEKALFRQQCYITAFIGTFIIILTILQLASL